MKLNPPILLLAITCISVVTGCMNICTENTDNLSPFTKFELKDARGNVIPPDPGAVFPEVIATNMQLRFLGNSTIGYFGPDSNKGPSRITVIIYDHLYSITNKGIYTFVVQPVVYKSTRTNTAVLERVTSPRLTTKVYLDENVILDQARQP